MAVIVSDTSPIRALHHLQLLPLLSDFYGTVDVPEEVALELLKPRSRKHAPIDVRSNPQFNVTAVRSPTSGRLDPLAPLDRNLFGLLHAGERAALRLALETSATLLLMDEKAGRSAADRLSLSSTGTIGILLAAKANKRIPLIRPLMDDLRDDLGFFISRQFYRRVLLSAGE